MIILFKTIVILLAVYSVALTYLYVFQDRFVFLPRGENPFTRDHTPMTPFVYQTPAGLNVRGLWYPPQAGKPVIVYFHGNKGNLGDRLYKAKLFIAKGYGVALVGYRGYSGNPGYPSEKNFMEDGRAALSAIMNKGIGINRVIVYGESLGTGVAMRMAYEMPQIKAVILEAPYTSIAHVASHHFRIFPVNKLLKHRFDSYKIAPYLKQPILVLHGDRDRTVPLKLGRDLFDAMKSPHKHFVELADAAHVNVYDYGAEKAIDTFLAAVEAETDTVVTHGQPKNGGH